MKQLKLIAFDAEDLGIIAAHVQDAVMHVSDLKFRRTEKRFFLSINRFVWENEVAGKPVKHHERRKAVLHFERVLGVQVQGVDQKKHDYILDLLTIHPADEEDGAGDVIEIIFAGGATLRLTVECIEAQLSDMAAAWETPSRPDHD